VKSYSASIDAQTLRLTMNSGSSVTFRLVLLPLSPWRRQTNPGCRSASVDLVEPVHEPGHDRRVEWRDRTSDVELGDFVRRHARHPIAIVGAGEPMSLAPFGCLTVERIRGVEGGTQ